MKIRSPVTTAGDPVYGLLLLDDVAKSAVAVRGSSAPPVPSERPSEASSDRLGMSPSGEALTARYSSGGIELPDAPSPLTLLCCVTAFFSETTMLVLRALGFK